MLRQDRPHQVDVVAQAGLDGVGQEGAFLEGEGIALAQVLQAVAVRGQGQLALDLLGTVDVDGLRAAVVAQVFAQALDHRARAHRRLRNVGQCGRQRLGQIEHELAEQHEAPQLVGNRRPGLAARLQRQAKAGLEQIARLGHPGLRALQRFVLPRAGRQQRQQDVATGLHAKQRPQVGPAQAAAHRIDDRKARGRLRLEELADRHAVIRLRLQAQTLEAVAVPVREGLAAGGKGGKGVTLALFVRHRRGGRHVDHQSVQRPLAKRHQRLARRLAAEDAALAGIDHPALLVLHALAHGAVTVLRVVHHQHAALREAGGEDVLANEGLDTHAVLVFL